jgi:hypothetical protein
MDKILALVHKHISRSSVLPGWKVPEIRRQLLTQNSTTKYISNEKYEYYSRDFYICQEEDIRKDLGRFCISNGT